MGDLEAQVLADRATRDAARAAFNAHYVALKADIEERGIAGRLADEAMEQAKGAFDEAIAVAEAHPGAVGGTIAALVLWLLRNPIIAWLEHLFGPAVPRIEEVESGEG